MAGTEFNFTVRNDRRALKFSITVGNAVRRTTEFELFTQEVDDFIAALLSVRSGMLPLPAAGGAAPARN